MWIAPGDRGGSAKEEKEHDRVAGDYARFERKSPLLTVMERSKEDSCADAGADHSFQRDVCHPCLGQIKDGLNAKPAPSRTPSTR